MYDKLEKWWNRKWSNWEFFETMNVWGAEGGKYPIQIYHIYKRTSNDGLVEYKRIYK